MPASIIGILSIETGGLRSMHRPPVYFGKQPDIQKVRLPPVCIVVAAARRVPRELTPRSDGWRDILSRGPRKGLFRKNESISPCASAGNKFWRVLATMCDSVNVQSPVIGFPKSR